MARPPAWKRTLEAAREEAALAVHLYNDHGQVRSFEGFVVHMHIAWLYLLHARFMRDGIDYRYPKKDNPRQFVKIDGEYKRWELGRCVEERWPDVQHPVRRNIEFFIALRNKIEHRRAQTDSNLGLAVSGHAQALLLNFEEELSDAFGSAYSMAATLRFPLFIGSFTTDGADVLRKLHRSLPADLRRFIGEFHDGLSDEVASDPRFELRLRVVLEAVNRDSDALPIQFTRWDDMTDEEKRVLAQLGKRGQTIIREQKRPVVGVGLLKPQEAEREVAASVPFVFNSNHFLRARTLKRIRPDRGDAHPERTDEKYCIYDEFSRSYGYTRAWVNWLIKKCSTEEGFREATGREPTAADPPDGARNS